SHAQNEFMGWPSALAAKRRGLVRLAFIGGNESPKAYSPRARRTVIDSPPTPQLSVSTSSITTTVVFGFLPRTSTRSWVTPSIRRAFCSEVAPSLVILIFT